MAATIKDLAKKTGLSLATISKYLNGGNVLPANRAVIEQTIIELGYSVNPMARGLKTKRSMTIGVLIPDLENVFCTSIVSHLENRLLKAGYSTLICNYQKSARLEREKFAFLADRQIDGLVTMPLLGYPQGMKLLNNRSVPIVLIDRPVSQCDCDVVVINNRHISYTAVNKLIAVGHQRIAIICGPGSIYTARERLQGYLDAHKDAGIPIDNTLIKYGDYYARSGFKLTKALMSEPVPPSALFITNNEMTIGGILALNDLGIKTPEMLSIIGFDNEILANVTQPRLSVVLQPLQKIGYMAADLVLRRIQEKSSTGNDTLVQNRLHILEAMVKPGGTITAPAVYRQNK